MRELEIAILIVVTFLLLISIWNIILVNKKRKKYNNYVYKTKPSIENMPAPGLEGYNAGDIKSTVKDTDWQQAIGKIGIDPATLFSHKQWSNNMEGKTTGSSTHSVRDDELDSNWLGLRYANTYKYAHSQPGARVVESNDYQDMPSSSSLRWRCHDYIGNKVTPSDCPWPPQTDQRYS